MKKLLLILLAVHWMNASLLSLGTASFAWDAKTDSPSGYNFYRGTKADMSDKVKLNTALITAAVYTDSAVPYGFTFYYAVTAVYATGSPGETGLSNIVSVLIPYPPPENLRKTAQLYEELSPNDFIRYHSLYSQQARQRSGFGLLGLSPWRGPKRFQANEVLLLA